MNSPVPLTQSITRRKMQKPASSTLAVNSPAYYRASLEREDRFLRRMLHKAERRQNEDRRHPQI